VDFNPPLAGKTLIYDVAVRRVLRTKLDKLKAIIHRRIPRVDIKDFKLKIAEDEALINLPEKAFMISGLQTLKKGIASDIFKFLPSIKEVTFVESHKRKEPAKRAKSRR
jgi:peptidylprolyl isomerase